jgi:hypothetical protein
VEQLKLITLDRGIKLMFFSFIHADKKLCIGISERDRSEIKNRQSALGGQAASS